MTRRTKPLTARLARILRRSTLGIGVATVAAGASQAAAPGLVLRLVGAPDTPATRHLFAIVGMFMAVIGGALTHATACRRGPRMVLFWAMVQKMGAVTAVGLGVRRGVFARRALLVAAFDLASAAVLAAHLAGRMLHRPTRTGPAR